ncbi:MAG: hypothetical protein Q8M03_03030 [Legionella sp.]|nr:hypothetical protein [Legionella sp.]
MKSADEIIAECIPRIDDAIANDRLVSARYCAQPIQYEKHSEFDKITAATAQYACPKIIKRVTELLNNFQMLLENEESSSQDINVAYQDLHKKMSEQYEKDFASLIARVPDNKDLKTQFSSLQERLKTLSKDYTNKIGSQLGSKYTDLKKSLKRKFSEIDAQEMQVSAQQEAVPAQYKSRNVKWTLVGGKPFVTHYDYKPEYVPGETSYFESLSFDMKYGGESMESILIKFNDVDFTNHFAQKLGFEVVPPSKRAWNIKRLQHPEDTKVIAIHEVAKFCRVDVFLTILEQYAPGSKRYFSEYFKLSPPTDEDVKNTLRELMIKKVDVPDLAAIPPQKRYTHFPQARQWDIDDLQKKYVANLLQQTFQITEALAQFKVYDDNSLTNYFCETLVQGSESLIRLYKQICDVSPAYISDANRELKKVEWLIQFDQYTEVFDSVKDRLNPEDSDIQLLIDKMALIKLERSEIREVSMEREDEEMKEDGEPPAKKTRFF